MTRAEPALVAIDLDGTLLDPEGRIPDRSRRAVAALRAAGIAVVLASGRSPWSMRDACEALELDGLQITMQGGLLASPLDGTIGRSWPLSATDVREHLDFARDLDLVPLVCLPDGFRAERLPVSTGTLPWPLIAEARHVHVVDDLDAWAGRGAIRTFLFTPPERHREVRDLADRRFGSRYEVVCGDEHGIELLAGGAGKGAALEAMAASRGIGLGRVAAIRDGPNDRSMLRLAGISVAMGSAPPDVKAIASFVVPPNREEGAYEALRRLYPSILAAATPTVSGSRPVHQAGPDVGHAAAAGVARPATGSGVGSATPAGGDVALWFG